MSQSNIFKMEACQWLQFIWTNSLWSWLWLVQGMHWYRVVIGKTYNLTMAEVPLRGQPWSKWNSCVVTTTPMTTTLVLSLMGIEQAIILWTSIKYTKPILTHHFARRWRGTKRCRAISKQRADWKVRCGFFQVSLVIKESTSALCARCHLLKYCQVSDIRCTHSQNLNVSRLVLQLPLPNPFKPGVTSRMKMQLEQHRQAMLQLHLIDQQFYSQLRCNLYYKFDSSWGNLVISPFTWRVKSLRTSDICMPR